MTTYAVLILVFAVLNLLGFFWLTIVAFQRSMLWGVMVLLFSPISAIVFALTNWFNAAKAFLVYIISFLLFAGTGVYMLGQIGVGNIQKISQHVQQGKLRPAQAYQLMREALAHNGQIDFDGENPDTLALTETTELMPAQGSASAPLTPSAKKPAPAATNAKAPDKPMALPMPATEEEIAAAEQEASAPKQPVKPVAVKPSDVKKPAADSRPAKLAPAQSPVPDIKHVEQDPLAQKKLKLPPKTIAISMNRATHYIGHYFIIHLKNGNERRGLLIKVDSSHLTLDRKLYGGNLKYRIRKSQVKSLHMLRNPPKER